MKSIITLALLILFGYPATFAQEYQAVKADPPAMETFSFQSPNRDGINLIYDQSAPGIEAYPSQYISLPANPPVEPRIQCADDFNVPEGQSWSVSAVGVIFMILEPTSSFDVFIYQNQNLPGDAMNGMPGSLITSFSSLPYEIIGSNPPYFSYEIFFPSPVTLPAGSYWISVVARVDNTQFPVPTQNWVSSALPPAGLGSEFYALAEPFNPFWTPGSIFFSTNPSNLAFALGGNITQTNNVPLSPYAILGAVLLIGIFIAFKSRIFKF